MLTLVLSQSIFGAYVCHTRPAGLHRDQRSCCSHAIRWHCRCQSLHTGEQVTSRYRQEDATQVETFLGVWMQTLHSKCCQNIATVSEMKKNAYFSLTVKQSACYSPDWTERKLTNLIEVRKRKNEKTRWWSDIQTTSGGRWRNEKHDQIVEIFVGGEFITRSNCWRPTCFTVSAGRSNNALTWIGAISVNTRTAVVAPIRWTIIDAWRKYKKY